MICRFLLLATMLMLGACSWGLRFEPGYANLDYPEFWEAKTEDSFSLGPGLLTLARWAVSFDEEIDEGERALIKSLRSLRVKTYSLKEGALDNIAASITQTKNALQKEGWTSIVSVVEEQSRSAVLIRLDDERIQGLVILHADAGEAVFFNMVGDLSLHTLAHISRKYLRGESTIAGLAHTGL